VELMISFALLKCRTGLQNLKISLFIPVPSSLLS
jgi:hypothetical protein